MATEIRPNPGRQEAFLAHPADEVWYGGLAGCGKSHALLLRPLEFLARQIPAQCVIYRRMPSDLTDAGGLVEKATALYSQIPGCRPRLGHPHDYRWKMPDGDLRVVLDSLAKPMAGLKRQGAEFSCAQFDELEHFLYSQYSYIWTRGRHAKAPAGSGKWVKPFRRATLNPVAYGWIREMVDWWIDEEGFAREDRVGVTRWYIRTEDPDYPEGRIHWADKPDELLAAFPSSKPESFSFIAGRRQDNPWTDWSDYERKLANQPAHIRAALLEGNWNATPPIPGACYRVPDAALFEDTDPELRRLLQRHAGQLRQFGAWDYGWTVWVGGILFAGAPPTLWVTDYLDMYQQDARACAAIRMEQGSALPELGVDRYAWQLDGGDPAGNARDSAQGWAAGLQAHGVPLIEAAHVFDDAGRELFWNSRGGQIFIRKLVQRWLDSGRLRVRKGLRKFVQAIREWRLNIPEGVDPEAVNVDIIQPRKDYPSHPGQALGYLVALCKNQVQAEMASQRSRRARSTTVPRSPAALAQAAIRRRL